MQNSKLSILLLAIFAFALISCSNYVDCGNFPEGISFTDFKYMVMGNNNKVIPSNKAKTRSIPKLDFKFIVQI